MTILFLISATISFLRIQPFMTRCVDIINIINIITISVLLARCACCWYTGAVAPVRPRRRGSRRRTSTPSSRRRPGSAGAALLFTGLLTELSCREVERTGGKLNSLGETVTRWCRVVQQGEVVLHCDQAGAGGGGRAGGQAAAGQAAGRHTGRTGSDYLLVSQKN